MARAASLAAALVLAVCVAGCGGDDDDNPGQNRRAAGPAGAPKPKEPLKAIVPGFERALRSGDCRKVVYYGSPSSTRPQQNVRPNAPPNRSECAQLNRFARLLRNFRGGKVAQFGPAGVIDSTNEVAPGKITNIAWTIDLDGSWKVVTFTGIEPQVGRRPDARRQRAFDSVVRQWVAAAKKGDCKELWRLSEAESRFVRNAVKRERYCRAVADIRKGRTPHTMRDFARFPDVRPEKLGATPDLAFYGLRFPNGRYITIDVTTVSEAVPAQQKRGHASPGVEDYVVNRDPR
jgi:hypothetical protein